MTLNPTLNSYVSLAEADDYHQQRASFESWQALDEAQKQRRLVSASDYLDIAYRFTGEKSDPAQLRQFPRKGDSDIPLVVKYAVCELALQAELNQNPEQKMSSVKVGPISVNYGDQQALQSSHNRFEYVKTLLNGLLDSRNGFGRVELLRG